MVVVDNNDVPHIVHAPGDIVHGAVVEVVLGCVVAGHNLGLPETLEGEPNAKSRVCRDKSCRPC